MDTVGKSKPKYEDTWWYQCYSFCWGWLRTYCNWAVMSPFVDSWLPKAAISIPLIGYLIVFNDQVLGHLTFRQLTSHEASEELMSSGLRLRFLYFGFVTLALGNILFKIFKPAVIVSGRTIDEYLEKTRSSCTFLHLQIMYRDLCKDEKMKYWHPYADGILRGQWESFMRDRNLNQNSFASGAAPVSSSWKILIDHHGDFVSSLIQANFVQKIHKRKLGLFIISLVSAVGYGLLFWPSIDLFKVILGITFSR